MSDAYHIRTQISWSQTTRELDETFRRWGVINWSTNYPRGARLEGWNQTEQDRTVELTYQKNGKTVKLTMGKQPRAVDNLRVLYLAIEAMRMNEKRGIGEILESAYKQLSGAVSERTPYEVLGVPEGLPITVYEAMYKDLAKKNHPDAGGSDEDMKQLNKAIEAIRKERNQPI